MIFIKNIFSYISSGIIIFLIISCIFLKISNNKLERENKEQAILISNLKIDNEKLTFSLEKQNREIEKHKIDFEKYANNQHKLISDINKKYDNITLNNNNNNNSCEQELNSMKSLLNIFNNK